MIPYYILAVLSIFLYLYSFFPVSTNFSQEHKIPSKLMDIDLNKDEIYKSDIDKVVIVIIDALRYDFITYNSTPYLIGLLGHDGCLSKVKAEAPTVTLPRIKALTTGNVPQFIDILLNLLDTESATDSILHQAVNNGKRIIFYGDDTWLKLYPDMFLRSAGTSSFYVYDFFEVDNNVTRNMQRELLRNDWDIMILHYLGLDHIGHVTGPFSSLIGPKLKEMDTVIKEIYDSMKLDEKLILVTGDHGMKDSGGHGGTTYSETTVPFALLGRKCSRDELAQSDIPMLLSVLLGLPFPSNSIGKISSKLLSSLYLEKLLFSLRYNALFLASKSDICKELIDEASQIHYDFLKNGNISAGSFLIHLYEDCLKDMSSDLVHRAVVQNDMNLILCIFTLLFCLTKLVIIAIVYKSNNFDNVGIFILVFISSSFIYKWDNFVVIIILLSIFLVTISDLFQLTKQLRKTKCNLKIVILIGLNILHGISMLSTSFIEEEHQTWYFLFTTVLIIFCMKNYNTFSIIILLSFRILRKLNQTGDKWAAEPDITQWLLLNDNYMYLHILYITSLILTISFSLKIFCKNSLNKFMTVLIFILIYFFKIFALNNVMFGQIIWFLIFTNLFFGFRFPLSSFINTWILIISLLYRPQNLILIPFCIFTSLILSRQIKSTLILSILHLWIGNVLYFCQGHSNSLASIDIAAGYIGLREYKPTYVLLQILCHTYSMPVLVNLLLLKYHNALNVWNIQTLHRLLLITITFTLSFLQRHHLFIWSVFAPKILLESSHTIILLIQMLLHHSVAFINNYFFNKEK